MRKIIFLFLVTLLPCGFLAGAEIGYGGWNEFAIFYSSKTNNNYLVDTFRLWMNMKFSKKTAVYLRGKFQHAELLNPTSSTSSDSTATVIDLDLGYFSLKLDSLHLTLGRNYFKLGQGVLFNGIADGLGLDLNLGKLKLSAFGNYTGLLVADTNPYNASSEDMSDGAKRIFAGLAVKLIPGSAFTFYAGSLLQRDQGDYPYNSVYFFGGLEMNWTTTFQSTLEVIYQIGESPSSSGTEDIKAMAAVFSTKLFFFDTKASGLTLDLAYASGSDNRNYIYPGGSTTTMTAGDDKQFYSFGVYSTGFVFEPDLVNLIYGSLSFQFRPFKSGLFRDSSLRLSASYYMKADKDAPISEDADVSGEAALGLAFDLQYSWRILSDLSLTLGYGVFLPGTAFSDDGLQMLGMAGISLAF